MLHMHVCYANVCMLHSQLICSDCVLSCVLLYYVIQEDCIGEFNMSVHSSFDIIIRQPRVNITVPRVWITEPRDFQFDNIILSFVTLFSLLPLEGWIALRDYVDVRVDIHQDIHDFVNQLELKTFLHLYVFIGANLGLTLFVGVIVANYNENRSNHAALLTVGQKQWLDLLQRIQLTAPKKIPPAPPCELFHAC